MWPHLQRTLVDVPVGLAQQPDLRRAGNFQGGSGDTEPGVTGDAEDAAVDRAAGLQSGAVGDADVPARQAQQVGVELERAASGVNLTQQQKTVLDHARAGARLGQVGGNHARAIEIDRQLRGLFGGDRQARQVRGERKWGRNRVLALLNVDLGDAAGRLKRDGFRPDDRVAILFLLEVDGTEGHGHIDRHFAGSGDLLQEVGHRVHAVRDAVGPVGGLAIQSTSARGRSPLLGDGFGDVGQRHTVRSVA
ncbi:MAG: hypothetical protein ACYSWU_29590, partial [Planctomycetota bacterium]